MIRMKFFKKSIKFFPKNAFTKYILPNLIFTEYSINALQEDIVIWIYEGFKKDVAIMHVFKNI